MFNLLRIDLIIVYIALCEIVSLYKTVCKLSKLAFGEFIHSKVLCKRVYSYKICGDRTSFHASCVKVQTFGHRNYFVEVDDSIVFFFLIGDVRLDKVEHLPYLFLVTVKMYSVYNIVRNNFHLLGNAAVNIGGICPTERSASLRYA